MERFVPCIVSVAVNGTRPTHSPIRQYDRGWLYTFILNGTNNGLAERTR